MSRAPSMSVPLQIGVLSFAAALWLSLAAGALPCLAAELTLIRHDGGITVQVDGQLFTDYLIQTGPKPILWPVIGPTGVPMSRAYPMADVEGEKKDHVHQRSLWFTHGNVNGVDFWSEEEGHGSIVHREYQMLSASGDSAVIATTNDWLGPDGRKHLEEERTMTFRVADALRSIDFDITLKATEGPVVFGDTKEGSMGIRIPTVMDVNSKLGGKIVNSEGLTDLETWGKPAAWVDYHGPIDGQVVGIAILNHPSSFRFPTTWHVREYGLFAANPFGLSDFQGRTDVNGSHTIPAGESMQLRYRFLFHAGDDKQADIAKAFRAYAEEQK